MIRILYNKTGQTLGNALLIKMFWISVIFHLRTFKCFVSKVLHKHHSLPEEIISSLSNREDKVLAEVRQSYTGREVDEINACSIFHTLFCKNIQIKFQVKLAAVTCYCFSGFLVIGFSLLYKM